MCGKPEGGVDILEGYFTVYTNGKIWSNKSNMLVGSKANTGY